MLQHLLYPLELVMLVIKQNQRRPEWKPLHQERVWTSDEGEGVQ